VNKFLILLILIGFGLNSFAQRDTIIDESMNVIEELIEELSANANDDDLDISVLFDDLTEMLEYPVDLNHALRGDLERFQFLTDAQINEILVYVKKNSGFATLFELQYLESFSPLQIQRLLPFVTLEPIVREEKIDKERLFRYGKNSVIIRSQWIMEDQKGYLPLDDSLLSLSPNSRYRGNRLKYYFKYQFNYRNLISWGFVAEKDPGEEFFKGSQNKGFDYYSFHALLSEYKIFRKIAIGDYKLNFGQGLILWSGMAGSKSSYVLNIRRKQHGISKYSSTDENRYMRGVATTVKAGPLDITGFFSYKKIDGNVSVMDSVNEEPLVVSTLQTMGIHGTQSQIEDKNTLKERIIGGNLHYFHEAIKASFTVFNYAYDVDLEKEAKPYNYYYFQGKSNTNMSLDYQSVLPKLGLTVFGETAMSQNGAIATTNGVSLNPAHSFSFVAMHRYFQPDFQAIYGSPFAESAGTANETGLYLGGEWLIWKGLKASAFVDTYYFPWLKFLVNSPSHGREYFLQFDYATKNNTIMYLRFKLKNKQENTDLDSVAIPFTVQAEKRSMRYNISYSVNRRIAFQSRIEFVEYRKVGEAVQDGFLLFQDVKYKFSRIPLDITCRYALFQTSSFSSAIYAYENDVLYGYSIPAYYSKGSRAYCVLKYTIIKGIDCWFRIAQTFFADKQVISTGLNEITGNHKTEVKVQLRFTF